MNVSSLSVKIDCMRVLFPGFKQNLAISRIHVFCFQLFNNRTNVTRGESDFSLIAGFWFAAFLRIWAEKKEELDMPTVNQSALLGHKKKIIGGNELTMEEYAA